MWTRIGNTKTIRTAQIMTQTQHPCRLTITNIGASYGFAVCDIDGSSCYLSGAILRRTNPQIGAVYEAIVVPNINEPDKTPWFCVSMIPTPAVADIDANAVVWDCLVDRGGVWSVDEIVAEVIDLNATDAVRKVAAELIGSAADLLYRTGKVGKFVEFSAGSRRAQRMWFTANPQLADVDEWDTEGA